MRDEESEKKYETVRKREEWRGRRRDREEEEGERVDGLGYLIHLFHIHLPVPPHPEREGSAVSYGGICGGCRLKANSGRLALRREMVGLTRN